MAVELKPDFDERPYCDLGNNPGVRSGACTLSRLCPTRPQRPGTQYCITAEAKRLIDEVAAMKAPVFILTGGDPLKRPDVFELVEYASSHGVRISLTPSATPLLTKARMLAARRDKCEMTRQQMQNNNDQNVIKPEEQRNIEDIRENSKKGKLPCGARYCFRCHEECGVLVNAYIMRDLANESSADDF